MQLDLNIANHFSFDLWLTLIKSNPDFKNKRNELFQSFFSIEKPIEEVARVIRYYDTLTNRISEGTGVHFNKSLIYSLVLNDLEYNLKDLNDNILNDFEFEVNSLFLQNIPLLIHSEIRELFYRIQKQGKTISLLSNTAFISGNILRNVLDFYNLSDSFLFQIYSDEVGISKPNYDIFDLVYQKILHHKDLKKTQIVHIGDNPTADYLGAINYGFNAILI